ncbi:hypothetical protein ROA7023_03327 [Roseisalinus antarcticus]|uniref:Uncharacterized protein n=1 Tax=Roseisalinus antarcticus TaxID=254357 RepID=A0A1Y5TSR5_9RHOB|nr:hypothetical protein ROA7023_03327 [Roseisalinus antarcticus]
MSITWSAGVNSPLAESRISVSAPLPPAAEASTTKVSPPTSATARSVGAMMPSPLAAETLPVTSAPALVTFQAVTPYSIEQAPIRNLAPPSSAVSSADRRRAWLSEVSAISPSWAKPDPVTS